MTKNSSPISKERRPFFLAAIERFRSVREDRPYRALYEKLAVDPDTQDDTGYIDLERPFSRLEYFTFLVLGIAMMWSW